MDKIINQKNILLLAIIIILSILIYNIYKQSNSIKEGFINTDRLAIDLLTKIKSYDAQSTNAINPADLELSIYPWTTKLYNLQSQNQVRAIGLYKPHLSINGIQYAKLGDMLSQHTDYTPPDNTESTLLIKKVGSDIKEPIDYTLIVNMGNTNLPKYYYQLNNLINPNLAISTIASNIQYCKNTFITLNTLLQTHKQSIINGFKETINTDAYLQIGNTKPLTLASLYTIPSIGNKIISASITNETNIIIPAGIECSILSNETEITNINFGSRINFSQIQTAKKILQSLSNNISLQNFTEDNIILKSYSINVFTYVNSQQIINYLNDLCNNISIVLNLPNISQDFLNYLNLADSIEGVSTVMAALSTITPSNNIDINTNTNNTNTTNTNTTNITNNDENKINIIASNNILSSYASVHNKTLLGGVLNEIINYNTTIIFPSIKFKPNILMNSNLTNIKNTANLLEIKKINTNFFDTINIVLNNNEQQSTNISNLSNLIQFNNAIINNQLEYFPLQIYEPVAPSGYKCLGHVFCNIARDLTKIKTMNNIACIPNGCIKEIRDWKTSDKVFEYNRNNIYWAIYKNPFIGTFIAVSKPGIPDGKVCKVVACVAKCTAVDELKKAEQCARTYQALNKNISNEITILPDLVASTEEDIYLQQIKKQNDNIITLQNRARQLQTDIDKSDIITTEMNKASLQNYVDTQKRNIELVAERLEKDKNKIQTNINIPRQVLNQIITIINNLPNLSTEQKNNLTSKIINNAQAANSGLLTSVQYNANLNNILKSCPQYDLTGLVKKSLIGDVCYGCETPE